jgi:hypothetical protein
MTNNIDALWWRMVKPLSPLGKRANCITENLNETESLHHRENLNQIGSPKGGPEDEANDERKAIGDCSDAREI